jgi:hypothetical protein
MPSTSLGLLPALSMVAILGGCASTDKPATESADASPDATTSTSAPAGASDVAAVTTGTAGKELPPELVGELRLQGADANGRLLTLAAGFIATAECSDCGAPSYLRFLAVRCEDTRHCEILTDQCEGEISREDRIFTIALEPVEASAAEACAGYSGVFDAL